MLLKFDEPPSPPASAPRDAERATDPVETQSPEGEANDEPSRNRP